MSSPPPPPPSTATTTSPTTTTTTPTAADPPPPPPPRKFPAPCWTQEETLALISAYQDKWYSLRRRNLRTSDWEAVASDVTRRCPGHSPPKTSAQCRHKMEKLRKRYRSEKQRFLSLPPHHHPHSRFFTPTPSSWLFFDLMDSMEAGSDPNPNPNPNPNLNTNPNPNPISNLSSTTTYHSNLNPPSGIPIPVSLPFRTPDLKEINNKDDYDRYIDQILTPIKLKVKNHPHHHHHQNQNHHHQQQQQHQTLSHPPHLNRYEEPSLDDDDEEEEDYYGGGHGGGGRGTKRKMYYEANGNGGGSRRDWVAEMVASIKMLGEGLMRMEKMKMDMMREIEKMRMEMEMKRSEMILESQQLIVNAFVEGLKKNKVAKVMEVE